jgi:acid phosphatase type 7
MNARRGPSALLMPVAAIAALVLVVGRLVVMERAREPIVPVATSPVLLAAGDIACAPDNPSFRGGTGTPHACQANATAELALKLSPTAVLALGDVQYGSGSLSDYQASFDRSWGRLRAVLYPVPGDEEYERNSEGTAYFSYFGMAAGQPGKGYYSFDLGSWHIIAINSNLPRGSGSPQVRWLRADLAANRSSCTLAFWHRPRFSSGGNGNGPPITALWRALYDYRADVVLAGNDHDYERFAPQTPDGVKAADGIREFVVGTGGASHGGTGRRAANSEVFNNDTFGLLRLDLHDESYDWRFVPEPGKQFSDSGHGSCNAKQR